MKTRPYFPVTTFLMILGSYVLGFLILTCLLVLFLSACTGLSSPDFNTILQSQPYVVDLKPTPYQLVTSLDKIQVSFSRPIAPATLSDKSFFVVEGALDPLLSADPDEIEGQVEDGKLQVLPATLEISENSQSVTWAPEAPILEGSVTLVITPALEGEDHVPFNQKPGENPTAFLGSFYLGESGQKSLNSPSSPSSSGTPPSGSPKVRPDFLVLNEILYDASASDTDGNEFIELYGTPLADLDGYQVVIVNGADGAVLKVITFPANTKIPEDGIFLIADSKTNQSTVTNIPDADLIENFDPQNGPDSIQLLDHQGRLLDAVAYGAGNLPQAHNGLATGEGGAALDAGAGHSLSRTSGRDTDENSVDFVDLAMPTPGEL